jgi:hypothetical protein
MSLDLEQDLLVKLCFFTADLIRDTIGHIQGEELMKKMNYSRLFFQFYGPSRHVVKQMTELHVRDPKLGPNGPVQVLTLPMLEQQFKAIQQQKMQQQRNQRMPAFMQEQYMQDKAYLAELQKIVLRGWNAPLSSAVQNEEEGAANELKSSDDSSRTDTSTAGDELDFSDLK